MAFIKFLHLIGAIGRWFFLRKKKSLFELIKGEDFGSDFYIDLDNKNLIVGIITLCVILYILYLLGFPSSPEVVKSTKVVG